MPTSTATPTPIRLEFTSCVTTTLLQCSDSTIAQTEKFDALECTNPTVGETCVVGCAIGYELASGDSLGALTCVSEKESVACLTRSLPACQVTRCSTSTNPVPIGVSEDYENVTFGASCQAACAVSFDAANHTELSCFAIGQLESNYVPPYHVCEEKMCVDVTTSHSPMLAPDCTDMTSGDECKVMRAVGYTGGASTLTCTFDVLNVSVSLVGILPNCSAASCAVDDIPSGMSHDGDGNAFLESCYANCSDGYAPVDVTSPTLSCGSNGFLVSDTTPFYPSGKALSCPSSALLDDDTVEGLGCSSSTMGEACVVTCAVGYTAAGDTETTLTCVFDPELQSMLVEGSAHSGKLAPCDLCTLMLLSTVSHDCQNTVFGESHTANCSYGNASISGTAASTVLTCGSDGALVSDPTLPYPTCETLTCSIGDLLLNGSLSGPDCASWTMRESCAVTCAEGYQAANETSGTLTCAYDEVAGDVVLEVAVPKCLSVVCSLGDPSTGVGHECRNIPCQGSCVATCTEGYDKEEVHFATLMEICHRKNAELEPKLQKYKGRVVLREDTVKDDSGACMQCSLNRARLRPR